MKAFKIRIALFELMGDKFTSLIDFDMTSDQDKLLETLQEISDRIKKFIGDNKDNFKSANPLN